MWISFLRRNGSVDIGLSYTANLALPEVVSPSASTSFRSLFCSLNDLPGRERPENFRTATTSPSTWSSDTLEEMEDWMDTTGKDYGEENTGVANVVNSLDMITWWALMTFFHCDEKPIINAYL